MALEIAVLLSEIPENVSGLLSVGVDLRCASPCYLDHVSAARTITVNG